jgi:hypothetical protein
LSTLPNGLHYACQIKAWFDEATMLVWVRDVIAPYVATAPCKIVPILLLDSFKVHMKATVVSAIQELGVEDHLNHKMYNNEEVGGIEGSA